MFAIMFTGTVAAASYWDDIKVIIGGHAQDAYNRTFVDDSIIDGATFKFGTFDEEAEGQDFAHWAKGGVKLVIGEGGKRYVQLNSDFESGPLPDGHVYVSVTKDINNEADFNNSVQIELGKLQNSVGASYYEIPKGVVVNSVTVWCKAFGVYIGSADLGRRNDL